MLVQNAYRFGNAPDENHFTTSRAREMGTTMVPLLQSKRKSWTNSNATITQSQIAVVDGGHGLAEGAVLNCLRSRFGDSLA